MTTYDVLNRVVTATNPLAYVVRNHWGALTLDSLTDAKGQTYKFGRNAVAWLVAQRDLADPSKADSAFYDAAGRQRKLKTRRGDVIRMSYDAVGRVTGISGPDFPADTFFYDPAGRWVVASNANGRDSSAFDARGRLVSATQRMPDGVTSYQMNYSWDIANRLTSRSAPTGGNPVSLKYNATLGDLDTLCAAGTCVAFRRNSEGLPGTEVFNPGQPGSWTLGRAFNALHQSTRDSFSVSPAETAFGAAFGYDSLGRLESVSPSASNSEGHTSGPRYGFDLAGRLTQACQWDSWFLTPEPSASCVDEYGQNSPATRTSYVYDPAGNRTEAVANPMVGAGNRVTRFKGYQLDYDANGNVWRKAGLGGTDPSDTTLLTWDARNRLVRVEAWPAGGAHTVVTFGYDALGRRVKKSVNAVTQWFVYDGDHVVLDLDAATGAVQAEYGYRAGVDNLLAVKTPSWTGIAITDPQVGTVRGIANAQTGATIKQYTYTAWGETQADTGATVRPRLAGREYDQETKLYYNRARYYDPAVGRFLSEDPIGIEGGLNLYTYAGNDPVNLRDPSGLMQVCVVTDWYISVTYSDGRVETWYGGSTMTCTGGGGSGMGTPSAGYPSTFGTFPGGGGGGSRPPQPRPLDVGETESRTGEALAFVGNVGLDLLTLTGIGVGLKLLGTGFGKVAFGAMMRSAARTAGTQFTKKSIEGAARMGSAYIASGAMEVGAGTAIAIPEVIAEANVSAIGAGGATDVSLSWKDFIPGYGTVTSYRKYLQCERGY